MKYSENIPQRKQKGKHCLFWKIWAKNGKDGDLGDVWNEMTKTVGTGAAGALDKGRPGMSGTVHGRPLCQT